MKYKIDCDDDGHWYKIPVEKMEEWNHWLNLDSDNEESWNAPDFAIGIDSPQDVIIEEPVNTNIEIISTTDLSKYKSNSLIIAKISREILQDGEMYGALQRSLADLRQKFDIDDSTTLFVTPEEFDVQALTEDDLHDLGLYKKGD